MNGPERTVEEWYGVLFRPRFLKLNRGMERKVDDRSGIDRNGVERIGLDWNG